MTPADKSPKEEIYKALLCYCGLLAGAMLVVAALVGIADNLGDSLTALIFGLVLGGVAGAGLWKWKFPVLVSRREVIVAAGLAWLVMILIGIVFYVASGAMTNLEAAIFESVAGFCTTSFSTLENPELSSQTVLFWRASTQWLGGLGALGLSMILIPLFFGSGESANILNFGHSHQTRSDFASYAKFYAILTVALGAAYALAGMGAFDAVTYAFTTVSTGGFANHQDSLGYFASTGVEWIAGAGMFLAGINGALLFKAVRGSPGSLWRSLELKAYVGITVLAFGLALAWTDVASLALRVRQCFFVVMSALSSTGFRVVEWGNWSSAAQMLLLLLIGTGAMAGSAGGGFQIGRAVEATRYLVREVANYTRQSKLGSGEALARVQAFQFIYLAAIGAGGFALACFGAGLIDSMSVSVSALATMGPALGDFSPSMDATGFNAGERAVLVVLMLVGRLYVYPVFLIATALVLKVRWISRR